MDKRIDLLTGWGCDTKGALDRVLGDERLYLECLGSLPADPMFPELERAVGENDVKAAFECAHTLKGVLGNLGVSPMYELITEIVEPLRKGYSDGLSEKLARLLEMRDKLAELLAAE